MDSETFGALAAPAELLAARIEYEWAKSQLQNALPYVRCKNVGGALHMLKFGGAVFLTAQGAIKTDKNRVTLVVEDKGTHRTVEIARHDDTDVTKRIAEWLADLVRTLGDQAAQGDQAAPAGEVQPAPRRKGRQTDPWNAAAIQRLLDGMPEDEARALWRNEYPNSEFNATPERDMWNKNVISKPALKNWRKKYRKK